jgi:dihydropteroate synthase
MSVTEAEERARVIPVIKAVARDCRVSVDTMKPAVARAAVAAGAVIWNDVTALRANPDSATVAAELGCQVVLMHMKGEPLTMQEDPHYEDVVSEVCDFLAGRAEAAIAAGVARDKIMLDPGIGFGKTLDHNLALLAHLDEIVNLGFPIVLGVSRKRFIKAIDPTAASAGDRLGGSLAAALAGVGGGAAILRVHDVRETVQALKVLDAIAGAVSSAATH